MLRSSRRTLPRSMHQTIPSQPYLPTSQTMFLTRPSITRSLKSQPSESLESEAITRQCLIDYMLNEAGWEILHVKGDIQGGKAAIEVKIEGMNKQFHPSGTATPTAAFSARAKTAKCDSQKHHPQPGKPTQAGNRVCRLP